VPCTRARNTSSSRAPLFSSACALAARRLYQTAAEYYAVTGDEGRAAEYRSRHQQVVQNLAANFNTDDPLRLALLSTL
jgi:hypothetical protein